jgi:hypothetical protein
MDLSLQNICNYCIIATIAEIGNSPFFLENVFPIEK